MKLESQISKSAEKETLLQNNRTATLTVQSFNPCGEPALILIASIQKDYSYQSLRA